MEQTLTIGDEKYFEETRFVSSVWYSPLSFTKPRVVTNCEGISSKGLIENFRNNHKYAIMQHTKMSTHFYLVSYHEIMRCPHGFCLTLRWGCDAKLAKWIAFLYVAVITIVVKCHVQNLAGEHTQVDRLKSALTFYLESREKLFYLNIRHQKIQINT